MNTAALRRWAAAIRRETKRAATALAKIEELRQIAAVDCEHPREFHRELRRWYSNGFGGGCNVVYCVCGVCRYECHGDSSRTRWVAPEHIRLRSDDD